MAGICTGDPAANLDRMRRRTSMSYPAYLDDGRAAQAFGVVSSPACVLVDKGGAILHRGPHPPEGLR